ncbi:MAG: hypothetical protein IT320_25445 [Anaerolineae bacterium]|nr:hypothetical protein [Anaerolineae bacterium]
MDEHEHKSAYISASDIDRYVYCQRAWWYRQQGFGVDEQKATVLNQGAQGHAAFDRQVTRIERAHTTGRRLLWLGIALLIVVIVVYVALNAQ